MSPFKGFEDTVENLRLESETGVSGVREGTPDAMSLRYADTSLPEFLGRPSLRFAEMSMRNTSKCASVIQKVFLNLCLKFK